VRPLSEVRGEDQVVPPVKSLQAHERRLLIDVDYGPQTHGLTPCGSGSSPGSISTTTTTAPLPIFTFSLVFPHCPTFAGEPAKRLSAHAAVDPTSARYLPRASCACIPRVPCSARWGAILPRFHVALGDLTQFPLPQGIFDRTPIERGSLRARRWVPGGCLEAE